jgi:hypothetical protein
VPQDPLKELGAKVSFSADLQIELDIDLDDKVCAHFCDLNIYLEGLRHMNG